MVDDCGICDGDGTSCNVSLSFGAVGNGSMEIIMSTGVDVYGFQFNVPGVEITGVLDGGSAEGNGFLVSTSGTTVIGFSLTGSSIPSGESSLVTLSYNPLEPDACIDDAIVSGQGGTSLDVIVGDCVQVLESETYTVNVEYSSVSDIAGFQFGVADGATILEATGGDSEANGFLVSSSATTVIGFSLTGSVINFKWYVGFFRG